MRHLLLAVSLILVTACAGDIEDIDSPDDSEAELDSKEQAASFAPPLELRSSAYGSTSGVTWNSLFMVYNRVGAGSSTTGQLTTYNPQYSQVQLIDPIGYKWCNPSNLNVSSIQCQKFDNSYWTVNCPPLAVMRNPPPEARSSAGSFTAWSNWSGTSGYEVASGPWTFYQGSTPAGSYIDANNQFHVACFYNQQAQYQFVLRAK